MPQISQSEAADLLSKLLAERVPVDSFFMSEDGTRCDFPGFVDSITLSDGIVVSASGPPMDASRGYVAFDPFDRECEYVYGERRELPLEISSRLRQERGESVLLFRVPGETFALFFTL